MNFFNFMLEISSFLNSFNVFLNNLFSYQISIGSWTGTILDIFGFLATTGLTIFVIVKIVQVFRR